MTSLRTRRPFHALVLRRRLKGKLDYFLPEGDFRLAARCERMRVDRNGSILSVLLIRLPKGHRSEPDVDFLSRVLEGRLRLTDTPGLLDNGNVAILLPDTNEEGAWKVATDVSEVYPPGPDRPECEVMTYPGRNRRRRHEAEEAGEEQVAAAPDNDSDPSELFFAKPLPAWKRGIDILGSLLGLVAVSPVIGVAAIAVKSTSPGPAFFVQEREGLGGRRFRIFKLRTMTVDADRRKHELRVHSDQDGPAFKMRCDPRITSVGRFLRWSSIDELPQLINVLRGEMSLVGPRPLPTEESQACEDWHRRRLEVTPGITCTWQVSGRGQVRFDDWVRMDLHYIAGHSLWKDFKLVVATLPSLLFHRGIR
ncbi:MAG: spore coat protein CotZ [Planctomycetaceae bacterium]|nr:spore coat protein CotZ [Planctomycetaceae bacterium]